MAEKPQEHFKGLVADLRNQVRGAVADARALKGRGTRSLGGFTTAVNALHRVYDEVDAATAEINGTLLDPGDNGGPSLIDDTKNLSAPSDALAESSDTRASNFSDLHPSQRVQTGLEPSGTR